MEVFWRPLQRDAEYDVQMDHHSFLHCHLEYTLNFGMHLGCLVNGTQQPMLQELGKQNPALLRLINENQAEFLHLINEAGGEDAEG